MCSRPLRNGHWNPGSLAEVFRGAPFLDRLSWRNLGTGSEDRRKGVSAPGTHNLKTTEGLASASQGRAVGG